MNVPSSPQLQEKDFIQQGYSKNPLPFWLWLFLLTAVAALIWGGNHWYSNKMFTMFKASPFLQVTNRQLSLFLWENPEFMRVNAKQKEGYLPGFFHNGKVTMDLSFADQYAEAPPDLLFRYHTWHRLLSDEFTPRPISRNEFIEFLGNVPEWQPTYWPAAPQAYSEMVSQLSSKSIEDLSTLDDAELPQGVRIAFQGWKNYFYEGEAINHVAPTISQMQTFLAGHPHYARNYWRNIVMDVTPDYLKSFSEENKNTAIPVKQMSPFLKAAIYNFLEAKVPQSQSHQE